LDGRSLAFPFVDPAIGVRVFAAAHDLAQAGIVDPVIGRLVDGIGMRARECREGIK